MSIKPQQKKNVANKGAQNESATTTVATPQPVINRTLAIGILVVTALLAAGVFFFTRIGFGSGSGSSKPTIEYDAGAGAGLSTAGKDAVVDSPLTIRVRIPGLDGTPATMLSGVTLQLLDEGNKPAVIGGKQVVLPMRATVDIEVWEYVGSVPSNPGTYRAEVITEPFARGEPTHTLDLRDPPLEVVPDTAPPLTSGYVLAREDDLWILSTDGSRERRLTYYAPSTTSESADEPAFSPDGKTVAFQYSPSTTAGGIPRTEIWGISPDGSNPHQLVAHAETESLSAPAWSQDGKYLYFTVETDATDSTGSQFLTYRTDRFDVAAGTRAMVADNAEMASSGGPGDAVVYLESVPQQEGGPPSSGQRIVISGPGSTPKRVVVSENEYPSLFAPAVSPDGKWVAFAAVNQNATTPQPTGFNLLKLLMLEPETALAHGVPWELYIVSASGGTPSQLTNIADDQPFPVWHDSGTLSFMGIKGLFTQGIDAEGKPTGLLQKVGEGVQHGRLTWHGP